MLSHSSPNDCSHSFSSYDCLFCLLTFLIIAKQQTASTPLRVAQFSSLLLFFHFLRFYDRFEIKYDEPLLPLWSRIFLVEFDTDSPQQNGWKSHSVAPAPVLKPHVHNINIISQLVTFLFTGFGAPQVISKCQARDSHTFILEYTVRVSIAESARKRKTLQIIARNIQMIVF